MPRKGGETRGTSLRQGGEEERKKVQNAPTAETSEAKRTRTRATLRGGMSFHISWSGKILKAKNLTDKKQRMNFLRKNQGIQTTPNCRRCPSEEDNEKNTSTRHKKSYQTTVIVQDFPTSTPSTKNAVSNQARGPGVQSHKPFAR